MIFRAALCPGAPLLIPGLAPALAAQAPGLVEACHLAVGSLRAADCILLLSAGSLALDERNRTRPEVVVHPSGTPVSSDLLAGSGPGHFTGWLGGAPDIGHSADPSGSDSVLRKRPTAPSAPGVGVLVGAALLAAAGVGVPVTAVEWTQGPTPATELLAESRRSSARVGVLVMADGSASRGSSSPGGGSEDAEALDDALAAAMGAGDAAALARAADLPPAAAAELLFTSGPAFAAFAELTAGNAPSRTEVLFDGAPLGVGYLVATWSWN